MKATEVMSDKSAVCREILDDLPEWFGIASAKDAYVSAASVLPMFGCYEDSRPVAFISLKTHNAYAAELYVLGVKRRYQGRGFGRALLGAALAFAGHEGLRILTVKTLADTHPDPHYAATRKFYEAVGFLPVEVFPSLWGPSNPCLLMMRPV